MFVSVTRLRLRRWLFLPQFIVHTQRSMRQAQSQAGFLGGFTAFERPLGFWTITVWLDEHSMRQFRNTGNHLKAMPRLLDWCNESSYVHWEQSDAALPTAEEAFERLRDGGKPSKVRHPSPAHAAGKTAPGSAPRKAATIRPTLLRT